MVDNPAKLNKIAIVVFARNEQFVIQKTVANIMCVLKPSDRLFVVADNCSDNTALIAANEGAKVVIRNVENPQGKSAALVWFMKNYQKEIIDFNFIVILDADSLIPPNFIENLNLHLSSETKVAQCYLTPINFEDSPFTTLIALSEILEQTIFDKLRASLGFSIRLRGTGMVFSPHSLLNLCEKLGTEVEDIALSILIAEQKIIITSIKQAIVFDPKPTDIAAASRQRARWFRGQWIAFWSYRSIIFRILLSGPSGWSVLSSVFIKPRSLKLTLLILLGFIFLWQPVVSAIAFSLAGFDILLMIIGLMRLPNRYLFLKALLYIPSFISMWVNGIFLSFKCHPWLRVRGIVNNKKYTQTDPLPLTNTKDLS